MSRKVRRIDPGDPRCHLVDQALHPELGQPQVIDRRRIGRTLDGELRAAGPLGPLGHRGRGTVAVAGPDPGREHFVAQPDKLRALLGQQTHDLVKLADGGIGGIEVVEPGHRTRF